MSGWPTALFDALAIGVFGYFLRALHSGFVIDSTRFQFLSRKNDPIGYWSTVSRRGVISLVGMWLAGTATWDYLNR